MITFSLLQKLVSIWVYWMYTNLLGHGTSILEKNYISHRFKVERKVE